MNMQTTLIDINILLENPDNPRKITAEGLEDLVTSIKKFPKMLQLRPLVITDGNVVLGGNMRLRACKIAGLTQVPVIHAKDLTPEEMREFVIKDNVGFGEWDWKMIVASWPEVKDWGLTIPYYALPKPDVHDDDFRIPAKVKTKIVEGDLLTIGAHRLMCGDSREAGVYDKLMGGKIADLLVTDPPYNVDYTGSDGAKITNDNMSNPDFHEFLFRAFTAAIGNLKEGGGAYVWHADSMGLEFRQAFIAAGFEMKQCLIWVKSSLVLGRQDYQWRHEPCLYGWKPGAAHYFIPDRSKTTVTDDRIDLKKLKKDQMLQLLEEIFSDKTKTTVLYHDKPSKNDLHPTMKPVPLIGEQITNSSRPGELVLDNFIGAGSTMVAAHQLERPCYGIDIEPRNCQIICDRMTKLDPALAITLNGQPYGNN